MSIGSRIKQRREELGYTQPQLAKLVGVSKGTIGNYESNISSPNENILFKLFDILKCDANFLYQDDIEIKNTDTFTFEEKQYIKKYRSLDPYGQKAVDSVLNIEYERCKETEEETFIELPESLLRASAGIGNWLDEEQFETVKVLDTPESRKADMIIEVDGDSMNPMYQNGDKVLVRLQPAVEIGEIGIFIMDGNGYIKEFGKNRLISLNPKFDDVYPHEFSDFRCVGKVIGKIEVIE